MKTGTLLFLTFLAIASISCGGTGDDSQILTEDQASSSTSTTETTEASVTTAMFVDPAESFSDFAELTHAADLIALGEIVKVLDINEINRTTNFSFKISQVLEGNASEEITLHQTGTPNITVLNDPVFEVGEKYVLFLRRGTSGIYFHLGYQGRFAVIGNDVYSMNHLYPRHISIRGELDCDGVPLETFLDNISGYID